jgi:hypothetical protein
VALDAIGTVGRGGVVIRNISSLLVTLAEAEPGGFRVLLPLRHDPEKCEAVFRKDHA